MDYHPRIDGIGQKHPEQREPPEEPPEDKGLISQVFETIQKGVDALLERLKGNPIVHVQAVKNLNALKNSLEILKAEDRSQDMQFLNLLSSYWNKAIEESVEYENHKAAALFKIFSKKILNYPEHQTHTFGYYLTEHAGQKWIPFPYMELIQKIHQEHEKNPTASVLREWTRLLNDLIGLLQES